MNVKLIVSLCGGLAVLGLGSLAPAADTKGAKVTFADNVSPILRNRCGSCHNPDKAKGGLNLETFSAAMQGGGSGKVIEPGDPDGSTLLLVVTHQEEPKMPPSSPKIPDAEIDVLKKWIEGGALETSGSVAAAKPKAKFEFKLDPASLGKPQGPPAMPEGLVTEPTVVSTHAPAVVAMAASPWAPLVAVGGHKQVLLYRTTDNHLVGVLPYPEGTVFSLRFSRTGALLLAGGGRGGQSGLAVAWDVKTGKRVFEIGKEKEYDVVLAADISPDQGQVALGGPGKMVRVYSTADGQLQFEMKKHTDWVTAVEFSPDGVLLATGDRANGLIVWEAQTGREFHDLRGHGAAITDVDWRLDSNVVASSSEDGTVKLWEMENGNAIKNISAHGGGAQSVRFAKDGRLVTTGRDRLVRIWDPNGGKLRDLEAFGDVALEAVFTFDETRIVAGDWTGEVRVYDPKDGKRLGGLLANPAPLASRLEQAGKALAAAQAAADAAQKAYGPAQAALAEKAAAAEKTTAGLTAATTAATQAKAAADALEKRVQEIATGQQAATDAAKAAGELVAKVAAARSAAKTPAATDAANILVRTAESTAEAAKAVAARLAEEAAPAAKAVADARTAQKAAETAAAQRKAENDQAVAARTAAEQAGAAPKAAFDAATAALNAAKAEADALAVEKKALDASKAAVGPTAARAPG